MADDTTNQGTGVEQTTESNIPANDAPVHDFTTGNVEADESQGEQQAADDAEEIDYEGSKYKVPKPLKDAFLRHADYTKKTQEVAEQRRAHEAAVKEFHGRTQFANSYLREVAQLESLNAELAPYESLGRQGWSRWAAGNPAEAQAGQVEYNALLAERARLANNVTAREAHRRQLESGEVEQISAKADQELRAKIKDWGPSKKLGLVKVAADYGFGNGDLAHHDPRVWMALNDLAAYRASLAKAKATSEPAEARPVPKVGGPAHAGKDPARMSMDEYARWMNRKERGRDAA
ncbi:MAG: hypothetical protein ACKVQK_30425 [Burkholderiales bacterium]